MKARTTTRIRLANGETLEAGTIGRVLREYNLGKGFSRVRFDLPDRGPLVRRTTELTLPDSALEPIRSFGTGRASGEKEIGQ